jgi:hypothetical protein
MTTPTTHSQLQYGIEIECGINFNVDIMVGQRRHGIEQRQLPDFQGKFWKAEQDGSLQFRGSRGVEFVSPKLRGKEGLDNITETCKRIKAMGGRTNDTCGLHIHVEFPTDSIDAMRRLTKLVARFEVGIFASTGTPQRARNGFCKPIKDLMKTLNWASASHKEHVSWHRGFRDRYQMLNWTNLIDGRFNAVEFRAFSGTVNPKKIAAWIRICLTLVQMALDGVEPDWDINPTTLQNTTGTLGESNLRCLFFYCWKGQRSKKQYGELHHETYTLAQDMKTLRNLAIRHDIRAGLRTQ